MGNTTYELKDRSGNTVISGNYADASHAGTLIMTADIGRYLNYGNSNVVFKCSLGEGSEKYVFSLANGKEKINQTSPDYMKDKIVEEISLKGFDSLSTFAKTTGVISRNLKKILSTIEEPESGSISKEQLVDALQTLTDGVVKRYCRENGRVNGNVVDDLGRLLKAFEAKITPIAIAGGAIMPTVGVTGASNLGSLEAGLIGRY